MPAIPLAYRLQQAFGARGKGGLLYVIGLRYLIHLVLHCDVGLSIDKRACVAQLRPCLMLGHISFEHSNHATTETVPAEPGAST